MTLQSRSRMSDLAAHHADELVVLQGLANLHLHNMHNTKAQRRSKKIPKLPTRPPCS